MEYLAAMFAKKEQVARKAYTEFMAAPTPDATLRLLREGAPEDDRILGDDEWIHSVLEKDKASACHESLDDIMRSTCERHAVTEAALASRSRRHSRIRAEIALVATEQSSATVTEIAKRFGRARSGLSRAMNRLRGNADK